MENEKRNRYIIVSIIVVLLLIVLGFAVYAIILRNKKDNNLINVTINQLYSSDYKLDNFSDSYFIGYYEDDYEFDPLNDMFGFIDYVEDHGYDITSSPFYEETSSSFEDAIDRNHPVHTTLYKNQLGTNIPYHVVVTIGYMALSNTTYYLNVIDGYTVSLDRWVNYDDNLLGPVEGIEINIY